jgi:2-methyl-3-hydroxypyridine 5-carboxylic acid dioxygenase
MHAEIAGAGFAGLAAAVALRQRGWSVRVHEKEAALRAFGAGIFVWENGLRVLHAIGAYDDVLRGAPQPTAYVSRSDGVSVTLEKVNGDNPFRLLTITRQHLYAGILAAAQREGAEICTRSEAVGARPEGVLQLADGRNLPADLVVAADGVRSALRDSLGVVGARRKYQDGLIRVLLEESADLVGEAWNRVIDSWVLNPRTLRILYAPCEEGRRYIGLMAPVDAKDASTLPINPAVWEPCFPEFATALRLIVRGRHDVYETTRLDAWSVGRVAIVGDAAHAMPPQLAQGACCAMMNALSLAQFVSDGSEVAGALKRWEAQERHLTDHTQARSAELARTRALGSGMQWDDVGLRAAQHVPTGSRPEDYERMRRRELGRDRR